MAGNRSGAGCRRRSFFLSQSPSDIATDRRTGLRLSVNHLQDVDARLWQDPLRTTAEHEIQVKGQKDPVEDSLHAAKTLREELSSSSYWVLAVMIPGGPYAEYSETRLRTRHAVLEALGKQNYMPRDDEHIGYIKIDQPSTTLIGVGTA